MGTARADEAPTRLAPVREDLKATVRSAVNMVDCEVKVLVVKERETKETRETGNWSGMT